MISLNPEISIIFGVLFFNFPAMVKFYAIICFIKIIKYIRVENETDPRDMIEYLYNQNEDGWNLPRPSLILSVTGGAKKFTIPLRMKQAFKSGLIKAAATTGAW